MFRKTMELHNITRRKTGKQPKGGWREKREERRGW